MAEDVEVVIHGLIATLTAEPAVRRAGNQHVLAKQIIRLTHGRIWRDIRGANVAGLVIVGESAVRSFGKVDCFRLVELVVFRCVFAICFCRICLGSPINADTMPRTEPTAAPIGPATDRAGIRERRPPAAAAAPPAACKPPRAPPVFRPLIRPRTPPPIWTPVPSNCDPDTPGVGSVPGTNVPVL